LDRVELIASTIRFGEEPQAIVDRPIILQGMPADQASGVAGAALEGVLMEQRKRGTLWLLLGSGILLAVLTLLAVTQAGGAIHWLGGAAVGVAWLAKRVFHSFQGFGDTGTIVLWQGDAPGTLGRPRDLIV